jgi:hypothetical protein
MPTDKKRPRPTPVVSPVNQVELECFSLGVNTQHSQTQPQDQLTTEASTEEQLKKLKIPDKDTQNITALDLMQQ